MSNTIMELNDRLIKEGKFGKKGNLLQCEYNNKLVKELKSLLENTSEFKILTV